MILRVSSILKKDITISVEHKATDAPDHSLLHIGDRKYYRSTTKGFILLFGWLLGYRGCLPSNNRSGDVADSSDNLATCPERTSLPLSWNLLMQSSRLKQDLNAPVYLVSIFCSYILFRISLINCEQ